jgi:hypothetical protein
MEQQQTCTCNCHHAHYVQKQTEIGSADEVRAIIDARIAALDAQLRSLKSMRNRCAPISSLPPEILSRILIDLVEPIEDFESQSWKTHIELTRVCTLWRKLAMQCPAFWSCLPFQAEHLEEMLARSRRYPLSIRVDISAKGGYPSWEILSRAPQPPRIRQLHLKGVATQLQRVLRPFPAEAPFLQSLYLVSNGDSRSPLPDHLFSAAKPSLKHLWLHGCNLNWDVISAAPYLTIGNLTTLKLTFFKDRHCPPYLLLLDILRLCPQLEVLRLSSSLKTDILPFSGDPSEDMIPLHHLTHYSVSDELSRIVHFLSHLLIPQEATATLYDEGAHSEGQPLEQISDEYQNLFCYCGLSRKEDQRQQFESAEICIQPGHYTELQLYKPNSTTHSIARQSNCYPSFDLTTSEDSGPFISEDRAAMLLKRLNLVGLVNLRLKINFYTGYPNIELDTWRSFFTAHHSIQSLTIRAIELADTGIIQALASLQYLASHPVFGMEHVGTESLHGTQDTAAPSNLALQSLQELVLEDVGFSLGSEGAAHRNYISIADMLSMRRNQGLPISLIRIIECWGFTEEMQEELEKWVDKVEWDGEGGDD